MTTQKEFYTHLAGKLAEQMFVMQFIFPLQDRTRVKDKDAPAIYDNLFRAHNHCDQMIRKSHV